MVTARRSMGGRRKCLVTGGAGFLGQHLVGQLVDSGKYEVTVFDIRDSGNSSVQTIVGDLRNLKEVEQAVAGGLSATHSLLSEARWYAIYIWQPSVSWAV